MRRGKFIVLEGIDGAGTEYQTNKLKNYLDEKGLNYLYLSYPDYKSQIGKLIHEYLHNKHEFDVKTQFLLYATDMVKDIPRMDEFLERDKIIVSDRYFTSTLVYQGLKGFDRKKGIEFSKLFGLPEPDLVLYLDVSAETSMERKFGEKEDLDRHEEDKEFLKELRKEYKKMARSNDFGKWKVIDGERSKQEVFNSLVEILREEFGFF